MTVENVIKMLAFLSKHKPYLYAGLVELGDARELLATVDVRVVALGERRFQLRQLLLGERRPVAPPCGRRTRARVVLGTAATATSGRQRGARTTRV